MSYCSHCGVEIEPGHATCPLCLRELDPDAPAPLPASQSFARGRERVLAPRDLVKRRLNLVVAILSGLVAVPAVVCLLVDWLYQGGGWSRFVVAALLLVWGLGFTPRLFFAKPLVYCLSDVGLVILFLISLDLFVGFSFWSLVVALPILLATGLLVVLVWLALRLYRRHTGFVLATVFGAAAILCLVIDGAVTAWLTGSIGFLWSLITLAALTPLLLAGVVLQLVYLRSSRMQSYLHW